MKKFLKNSNVIKSNNINYNSVDKINKSYSNNYDNILSS